MARLLKSMQDIAGTGITICGVCLQTAPYNGFEWCRKRAGCRDFTIGKMPGEHLIKDYTQRVDVVACSGNPVQALRGHKCTSAYLVASGSQRRTCLRA